MTSFIHFADAHINNLPIGKLINGVPVYVQDRLNNFDYLVDFAIAHTVDYVLFAGDMYYNSKPPNAIRKMVYERINRLTKSGIKVVMIPGNHDMTKREGGSHALVEFKSLAPNGVYLVDTPSILGFPDLSIACIPWLYGNQDTPTLKADICLAHCSTTGAKYESGTDVGEQLDLGGNDFVIPLEYFDYYYTALGHIHKAQVLNKNVVYPGSIDLLTWGEAKDGSTHGFVYWHDNVWEQIAYPKRKHLTCEIDLDNPYTLPEFNPEWLYEFIFYSQDPLAQKPDLSLYHNAIDVKDKIIKPTPNRARDNVLPVEFDINTPPLELVRQYHKLNDLPFDGEMELLCMEIMTD